MKIINFISFIPLVVQIMAGPYCSEDKNDCTKLYNFIRNDTRIYGVNDCCSESSIQCNNGFITSINRSTDIHLDYKTFPCFSRLRTLVLENFPCEDIPSGILNSESLEYLSLIYGRITTISDKLFQLPNLQSLILSYNRIGSIPSSVNNAKKLNQLRLVNNNIKELPAGLFELPKLKKIDLSENMISEFPSFYSYYETKLKKINISSNRINVIPSLIDDVIALEELYISKNQLEELPNRFYNLSNLKILDLSANFLTEISPNISGLKNLWKISLNNNELNVMDLPDELLDLPNIKEIEIGGNIINIEQEKRKREAVKQGKKVAIVIIIISVIFISFAILSIIFIKRKHSKKTETNRHADSFQDHTESEILNMNQSSQNLINPNNINYEILSNLNESIFVEIGNNYSNSQINGFINSSSSDWNEEIRSLPSKVDFYINSPLNQGFDSPNALANINIHSDIHKPNSIPIHGLNESRNFNQSRIFNSNLGYRTVSPNSVPPVSYVTSDEATAVNATENRGRSSDHPKKTFDYMPTNNNEQN